MGWSSGSELAAKIWSVVQPEIPPEKRLQIAIAICRAFEDMDCDTLEEAVQLHADTSELNGQMLYESVCRQVSKYHDENFHGELEVFANHKTLHCLSHYLNASPDPNFVLIPTRLLGMPIVSVPMYKDGRIVVMPSWSV